MHKINVHHFRKIKSHILGSINFRFYLNLFISLGIVRHSDKCLCRKSLYVHVPS